jgi:hypothetical protein
MKKQLVLLTEKRKKHGFSSIICEISAHLEGFDTLDRLRTQRPDGLAGRGLVVKLVQQVRYLHKLEVEALHKHAENMLSVTT